MQQPLPPPTPPSGFLPGTDDTRVVLQQLARLGSVMAILVGLVGAIAVQVIFVGTFLPQIMSQENISSDNSDALTALADVLGFAVFWMFALMAGRGMRGSHR